jgi:hypothetical protein
MSEDTASTHALAWSNEPDDEQPTAEVSAPTGSRSVTAIAVLSAVAVPGPGELGGQNNRGFRASAQADL